MSLKTLLAGAVALAILTATAGCSDDAPSISTNAVSETTTPIETSMAAPVVSAFPREVLGVTVPAEPRKIVSASATHTEILFALGAGDRIIAVDLFSDYPAETGEKEKIDAYNLNVEAVAAFDPDLVILSFDPGDAVAGLGELGIPVILFSTPPETLQDAYAEMEEVGAAIGADEAAANLVAIIETEVSSIISTIPPGDGDPPTYYHELGEDLYSITSSTFIGTIYSMVGLRNIADPADDYGFGYPQLSAEYILETDPDFIFLADTLCCGQSASTLAERPGWDTLSAVQNGRVIELDDSVASRWGPRIVEFLRTVATAVHNEDG